MSAGFRAEVEIEFKPSDNGGLRVAVERGNRSLLYQFTGLGPEDDEVVTFGAVVDDVTAGGPPGTTMTGWLWFWVELAEVYATPATTFEVWHAGRIVGHGTVL